METFVLSFKNDAHVKSAFTEHLVCARHCSKHFTNSSSLNSHNNSKKEVGKLRHGAGEELLKATQFVSGTAGIRAQARVSSLCPVPVDTAEERARRRLGTAAAHTCSRQRVWRAVPGLSGGHWETPDLLLSSPHFPARPLSPGWPKIAGVVCRKLNAGVSLPATHSNHDFI